MNLKVVLGVIVGLAIGAGGYYFFSNNKFAIEPRKTSEPSATQPSGVNYPNQPVVTPSASATPGSILPDIEAALVAKRGPQFAGLNYSLNKIEGDYASGTVGGSGGGGMWFAAKVGGKWVIVWDGNGSITCGDLSPYPAFPSSIIPECWDTTSNKIITR